MRQFQTAIEMAKYITANFPNEQHEILMSQGLRNKKVLGIYSL